MNEGIYTEIKIFLKFFIETFLLLLIIQLVSDKIDNSQIKLIKDSKISLLIATILYITNYINKDMSANISQGLAYGMSGVFLSKYAIS
jgi:hypothetical protein